MQEALKTQSAPARQLSILVPLPVETGFTYLADEDYETGTFVSVPWGKTTVSGVVEGETQSDLPLAKLKSVLAPLPLPALPPLHLEFLKWVARYTMSPLGSVLKMTLSEPSIFKPAKKEIFYTLQNTDEKIHPRYAKIIAYMEEHKKASRADIVQGTGASLSVLKTLTKKNILLELQEEATTQYPCANLDADHNHPTLTESQKKALDIIHETKGTKPILLDGVTGAGKTEVYFEAVAECLKRGQQALILAPEITLTNAFTDRFEKRFGGAPALWHSDLSHGVRRKTWLGVAQGKTQVIIGARSSLFLPYKNLGLIIIDEEHDNSYKQEEGVTYNARDMAIVRAHLASIPVILVSATPSLETLQNTWDGRYAHAELPARYGQAEMPDVQMIDLRQEKMERQRFIGPTLEKALLDTLSRGEQSLLFLNRRG
ncbi:MAG: primosomal protein N', partial [Alphaproteobacteria bacterium]|nr:primosomal protein N' [Alphaproteobacteria bacterium]